MNAPSNPVTRAEAQTALEAASRAALRAPSVFNTQPWAWRIAGDVMELSTDPQRRLGVTDAEGRLLLLSCGGALHHARMALAAEGWQADVQRLPEEQRPDLLARIRLTGRGAADPVAAGLVAAISRRRTDRRAFGERQVSDETLTLLRRRVEEEGAYLHVVPDDRVPELAVSVDEAADAEFFDPAYRSELTRWTSRPAWTGDGVPPATAVQPGLRRVPMRNFLPDGSPGLLPGADHDEGAAYVILFGTGDRPVDLLRAGEAMSALLLAATAEHIATAPISEAVEVAWPRRLLARLLSGVGEPYLIVRLGYVEDDTALPATPRRAAGEVIHIDE
ncbi:Acg family FMN-binding oxidoreductase [Mangrovihabitans endophyticus]|uniref:NAD(P)H nitroreductase n=1 Tax=Mangrovihabitans endophyticus TaxID=1751298 RepID=A0A8J3C4Z0_9ACTN|nr:nitroreductase [Mangrovihabitans endophyticus]GGL19704.1 NAD(P)H nitroreductase [Mangrovihabitans endophyticus]